MSTEEAGGNEKPSPRRSPRKLTVQPSLKGEPENLELELIGESKQAVVADEPHTVEKIDGEKTSKK